MATSTFTVRQAPRNVVARVDFPADMEGHGIAHYEIAEMPPLRHGMAPRYLGYLVLDADGRALNDNLPLFTRPTLEAAIARASVDF